MFTITALTLLLTAVDCPSKGNLIVVTTKTHQLALCEEGREHKEFEVSIGKGGAGKTVEGDNKTPLGNYPLGIPRASKSFWKFVPIGYPTDEQKKKGFTGQDVGIHGPHHLFRWMGKSVLKFDWTQGCIAVSSNEEIDEITAWIQEKQVKTVEIREASAVSRPPPQP